MKVTELCNEEYVLATSAAAMMSSTSIRRVTAETFTCARTGRRPLFTIYTCYACLVLYTVFGADTRTRGRRGARVIVGGLLSVWRRGGARARVYCVRCRRRDARAPSRLARVRDRSEHGRRQTRARGLFSLQSYRKSSRPRVEDLFNYNLYLL